MGGQRHPTIFKLPPTPFVDRDGPMCEMGTIRPIETGLIGQVVTGFELGNVGEFLIERHEVSATLQPESLYRDECNNR